MFGNKLVKKMKGLMKYMMLSCERVATLIDKKSLTQNQGFGYFLFPQKVLISKNR